MESLAKVTGLEERRKAAAELGLEPKTFRLHTTHCAMRKYIEVFAIVHEVYRRARTVNLAK